MDLEGKPHALNLNPQFCHEQQGREPRALVPGTVQQARTCPLPDTGTPGSVSGCSFRLWGPDVQLRARRRVSTRYTEQSVFYYYY